MLDRLVMRTMGGVRVVDHMTGQTLLSGVRLTSDDLRFARTASGAFQIVAAPGFADYARAFDPVPAVAARSFAFEVHDLTRRFLPVAASIALPRDPAPGALANRVDEPVVVALPSAGGRFPVAGMTSLRVTLVDQSDAPVLGALVQALRSGSAEEIGWGLTDRLGSAFLPITGLPTLQEAEAPDDEDEDEDERDLVTGVTLATLRITADPARRWPADVAGLRAGGGGLVTLAPPETIALTAGKAVHRRLAVTLN